jgi:hypothetical protein
MHPALGKKYRVDNLACFIFFANRLCLLFNMFGKKSFNFNPFPNGNDPERKCEIRASRNAISSSVHRPVRGWEGSYTCTDLREGGTPEWEGMDVGMLFSTLYIPSMSSDERFLPAESTT